MSDEAVRAVLLAIRSGSMAQIAVVDAALLSMAPEPAPAPTHTNGGGCQHPEKQPVMGREGVFICLKCAATVEA